MAVTPADRYRYLLIAALALGLVVTGCGSSGDSARPAEPEVKLGEPATTVAKPPQKAARRTARPPAARPRAPAGRDGARRPPIKQWPIPYPAQRRQEMAAYARRHYGRDTDRLQPKVIVEHFTVTPTAQGTHDIFAADRPDPELKELPGTCAHFLIDRDGTIFQLAPLELMCRHTVGLNDVAIGIEHVGGSDAEVMGDAAQLAASYRLSQWLRCRYGIAVRDVIGHSESLGSPYHHEQVARLKTQSHSDFQRPTMDRYRRGLARRGC